MNNTNEPAMPIISMAHNYKGLTKREYLAAMAMQGLAAGGHEDAAEIASHAVIMADALLSALDESDA